MRLITFQSESGPRVAAKRDGQYVDLRSGDDQIPRSMKGLLEQGEAGLQRAADALGNAEPIENVRILAPVPSPQKIICIGLNYSDHAAETGTAIPAAPVVFNKFPTAVRATGDPIELPSVSDEVDFEAELVVVIGTGGRNITQDQAFDRIAGYTCGHDVSARDWQKFKSGGQWLLGKTFDSFAPVGPELVTRDEIKDVGDLNISLRLNGETMQDSNTRELIFKVDFLVSYLSQICTLRPGDLIYTGTPPGVGFARTPPVFLQPGDEVEVEIEKIGVLKNPVVAAG